MDRMEAKKEFIWAWTWIKRAGKKDLWNWMDVETDFFHAPASAGHHGAFPGGLLIHSVNVYRRLREIVVRDQNYISEEQEETIAILGLLHDVCKVNCYHDEQRYRLNTKTGAVERHNQYVFRDPFPFGHGEKSVYLISRFLKLTDEEALAIRWHMGAFDFAVKGTGMKTLDAAMDLTPWVWRLHEADMCANNIDERQ